jgi:hypothetical protein
MKEPKRNKSIIGDAVLVKENKGKTYNGRPALILKEEGDKCNIALVDESDKQDIWGHKVERIMNVPKDEIKEN